LPFSELEDELVRFSDLTSDAVYDRQGNEVLSKGIYLDMPAWAYHVFDVTVASMATVEEINITEPKKTLQRTAKDLKPSLRLPAATLTSE